MARRRRQIQLHLADCPPEWDEPEEQPEPEEPEHEDVIDDDRADFIYDPQTLNRGDV